MKKYYSYIGKINIALMVISWIFFDPAVFAQVQTNATETDPVYAEIFSNAPPPPPGFATPLDYVKSFTNSEDIINAYHAGLINQGEAMLAMEIDKVLPEDKASMDTYGKVVDQNGQPIAGVQVQSHLEIGIGSYEEHDTITDPQGQFHYLGLHGRALIMHFHKEGYDFDERLLPERPGNYLPDTNNPLIITMWKLQGAEPMVHTKIGTGIACDGTPTQFDLLSGKKSPDGDLIVSLTRNPVNIDRRKPFNWSVSLKIQDGGLQEITNVYAYEAPAEGYQSTVTLDFPTNMVRWQPEFQHSYYFKSRNGQAYGRIIVDIYGNFQPPPTYFGAEIYANPDGSRNLEFDYRKQIRK